MQFGLQAEVTEQIMNGFPRKSQINVLTAAEVALCMDDARTDQLQRAALLDEYGLANRDFDLSCSRKRKLIEVMNLREIGFHDRHMKAVVSFRFVDQFGSIDMLNQVDHLRCSLRSIYGKNDQISRSNISKRAL